MNGTEALAEDSLSLLHYTGNDSHVYQHTWIYNTIGIARTSLNTLKSSHTTAGRLMPLPHRGRLTPLHTTTHLSPLPVV